MDKRERQVVPITEERWQITRIARLDEVHLDNGAVRFRVEISDAGRPPFASRWFNDPVPASDFMEQLKAGRSYGIGG